MLQMKTASTRALFAYWDEKRGERIAPARSDIDPCAIRQILGDTFILACDRDNDHPFRLAGTGVCAIFGRELRGEPFVNVFALADRADVRELVGIVANEARGVIAGALALTDDERSAELELLLLPLLHHDQTRLLGALAPIKAPFWLGRHPAASLLLGTRRHLEPGRNVPRLLRGSELETHGGMPAGASPSRQRPLRGLILHPGGRP
jgi:hypothetical protein